MWLLNPDHRTVTELEESVDCAWAALGHANPCLALPATLDPWTSGAAHATCCVVGEATRGHNAVTTLVHAAAQSFDCTAEMEVTGLIPGTDLRGLRTSSPLPWATPTPPLTSRSAPHTLSRPAPDCTQTRH